MKIYKEIPCGSQVFFSDIPDYTNTDVDVVILVNPEDVDFIFKRCLHNSENGRDEIYIVMQDKDELIHFESLHGQAMSLGHYLLPDFCSEFGITIEDLRTKLGTMRDRLDYRHKYLGIIYDAYLENNSMTLTDQQRQAAFNEYKKERKHL